ncbi:MAG: hypothetical protein M3521_13420 [Acidobacteriota bacterium]|nr:hypothetical protein [Acidobacteriota bacterium]
MKLWKKIAIVIFVIVFLAQIPFIYNRYKIGQLAGKISTLETQKIKTENQNYNDFQGVIHVHTLIGGHSTGNFDELIDGAKKNALDFVVMTEHTSEFFDSSEMTLRGVHNGILFVNGQEVETASRDRFLLLKGSAEAGEADKISTPDFLRQIHTDNKLAFITYPEKHQTWDTDFDGIEVFSLHTNAKKMNPVLVLFDAVWSYYSYPELVLAKYFQRPGENLQRFDEVTVQKKSTLFAGTDAHSNIGFHLFGDDAGNKIINVKIDAYETIFRTVRNHVLLEKDREFNQENLLDALKNGHCFVGFDALSVTEGFLFTAENGAEMKIMGDEITLTETLNLKISAPQIARFVIFKNGEKIFEETDKTEINFHAKEKGTYRTEVYLDSLGAPFDKMPWIISNPIYVK